MTKVKICGITNLEDARLAAKFGADALGFNFYAKSPRCVTPAKAREIIERLPRGILKVGVFVNESLEKIAEIASAAKLDALQLHGEETPEFARELKAKTGLEIIKAFRVSPEFKPEDVLNYDTDAILLDAYNPNMYGGTGETFDKRIARQVSDIFPKMYFAGGLDLENVSYSIDGVFPYYVDVCSGIEQEKGKKDKIKTINFLKIAKSDFERRGTTNIYDFFWQMHPMFYGFRLRFNRLENLIDYFHGFLAGWGFGAGKNPDLDHDPFFSRFYRNRIDPLTGAVDESLPENHLNFRWFVSERCRNVRGGDWSDHIIAETGGDGLDALNLFYALLEEYRIDFDNYIEPEREKIS